MKPLVTYDEFAKMDFRVGKIVLAEKKEGSEKLLRLKVNFGEEGERNILSGIAQWFQPEDIMGKLFVFIINLEPRMIMGEASEGMILAADGETPAPLTPSSEVLPGTMIK